MKRIVLTAAVAATLMPELASAQSANTVALNVSAATVCAINTTVASISLGVLPVNAAGVVQGASIAAQTVAFTGYCNVTNSLTVSAAPLAGPAAVANFSNLVNYSAAFSSQNNAAVTDASGGAATTTAGRLPFSGGSLLISAFDGGVNPILAGAYSGAVVVTLSPG